MTKNVRTNAGGGGRALTGKSNVTDSQQAKYRTGSAGAFTMAEILLSLTIIGVVAAITLPSLTGNINERTWNTQRKALYSRFSQAIALMPALNSYGKLSVDEEGNVSEDTAAETFVTEGLSKVLKINNICDSEHLQDCGIPAKYNTKSSTGLAFPKDMYEFNSKFADDAVDSDGPKPYYQTITNAAAFETQNGESIAVFYYPQCKSGPIPVFAKLQPYMCANFIYDLNGSKGPNTFGKDIGFVTVLYPTDSVVVSPMPVDKPYDQLSLSQAMEKCRLETPTARVPNLEEAMAIFYNNQFIDFNLPSTWTSTPESATMQYTVYNAGQLSHQPKDTGVVSVHCVQR